ncbi:MAG: MarR family transcriptional regulator [Rhodobacteraceae bacterium]|nr:MAG: MarR family transcriptional regulator [Paracoccaceae bacterium]
MGDHAPEAAEVFDLGAFLPYRMAVAAERLSVGMSKRYRDEFGISIAEWRVLVNIADRGAVSVRDIEREVHLEKSKASRAASRLEAGGYVTKAVNAQDRRLVVLQLTEAGEALMAQLARIAMAYQARLDQMLAPEIAPLNRAIDRILSDL